jgi:hypothetical protein
MTYLSDEKLWSLFFTVQGTGGSQTGPDPENRLGDQDIGSPGRPIRHKNRPLFLTTLDSVLQYREVIRAKDLSALPRNVKIIYTFYQNNYNQSLELGKTATSRNVM